MARAVAVACTVAVYDSLVGGIKQIVATTFAPTFIRAARAFYGGVLGLEEGRSSKTWIDWNLMGHQVVTHWASEAYRGPKHYNGVGAWVGQIEARTPWRWHARTNRALRGAVTHGSNGSTTSPCAGASGIRGAPTVSATSAYYVSMATPSLLLHILALARSLPPDADMVPVPHFGVCLAVPDFHVFADRLKKAKVPFILEPHLRFAGAPGEQWSECGGRGWWG